MNFCHNALLHVRYGMCNQANYSHVGCHMPAMQTATQFIAISKLDSSIGFRWARVFDFC